MNGTLVRGRGREPVFMAISRETLSMSADSAAPSHLQAMEQVDSLHFFEYDDTEKAMRNVSGRTLTMRGTLSYHLNNANNSERSISVFSEVKISGGSWVKNADSGRKESVRGDDAKYSTKSSEVFELPHDALLRFGFFAGAVGVSLLPVSFVAEGVTVTGPSFRWTLKEI